MHTGKDGIDDLFNMPLLYKTKQDEGKCFYLYYQGVYINHFNSTPVTVLANVAVLPYNVFAIGCGIPIRGIALGLLLGAFYTIQGINELYAYCAK